MVIVEGSVHIKDPNLVARLQRQKGENGNGQIERRCTTVKIPITVVGDHDIVNSQLIAAEVAVGCYVDMRFKIELEET